MFKPISNFAILSIGALALSACGKNDGDAALKQAEAEATKDAIADGKIECALDGAKDFQRNCTTERMATQNGQLLVIRHPNGGFRRFRVLTDGRGLEPADGFDATSIKVLDGGNIELSSADDRYRLPAKIKADTPPPAKAQ